MLLDETAQPLTHDCVIIRDDYANWTQRAWRGVGGHGDNIGIIGEKNHRESLWNICPSAPIVPAMTNAAVIAVTVVALIHVYILALEMFLWTKPAGLRAFGLTPERAESSRVLAANQGLYNGFLAAGLLWSTFIRRDVDVIIFFLACVIIAGVYGAITASRKILYVQALPALVALVLVHMP